MNKKQGNDTDIIKLTVHSKTSLARARTAVTPLNWHVIDVTTNEVLDSHYDACDAFAMAAALTAKGLRAVACYHALIAAKAENNRVAGFPDIAS